MPKGENSGGAKHRNKTSFAPQDPVNPRAQTISFRPSKKMAAAIETGRGTMTRTMYLTLLLGFALTETKERPPGAMLQYQAEFLD